MPHDSYGYLRGKWSRMNVNVGGTASELHMRIEDETEDTLCGLDAKGARIVIAKRCIDAAFESAKGTTEIRTERGIENAASRLRDAKRRANRS